MTQIVESYEKQWSLINEIKIPTLLVNYEKILVDKDVFIKDVNDFLNINPTQEQIINAKNMIRTEKGYVFKNI